jgi:hypothetical protein
VKGMKKLLLLYSIFTSCAIIHQTGEIKQGISGKIYLKQGNYMPAPGMPKNTGKLVSKAVWVYELTKREQVWGNGTIFDHIHTKLIAKAQSNAQGVYSVALPPGNYSVFINDDGKFYANSFDGEGNINPVEVKKNSVTPKDITISINAVY